MFKKPVTLEHALFALALAIAIAFRFINLGLLPLSDYEATWALQSLGIADGLRPILGPNPGYLHLTAILFYILGSADFWARFWPALAGSALVLTPWFVRARIGRVPALVLAFGLAIDPGLNAFSRLAGGPMLAITFLVFTLVFWLDGRRRAAAAFAGLALLCGPSVWLGIFGLLLAWALNLLLTKRFLRTPEGASPLPVEDATPVPAGDHKKLLAWAVGTFLIVGSLLLLSLPGLAAAVSSLLVFLSGWVTLSGLPLGRVFLALPAYELLPLFFAFIALVRGLLKRDALTIRLGLWTLAALLLVLINVSRQVSDLSWVLLPLWTLAAIEISRYLDFSSVNRWVAGGLFTFIFVLLILSWLTLAEISIFDPASTQSRLEWFFLAGIFLVIAISSLLVGTGWSTREAWLGGAWGFLLPLLFFTIAMSTGAAGLREPRTFELWHPEPRLGRADLVLKVANEISILNTGLKGQLPMTIAGVDSPALRWMFRNWNLTVTNVLSPTATPELVITPIGIDLSLTADYRGEPLVWREIGDWDALAFTNWLNWVLYRQMPVLREDIILWVRADQMLDSQDVSTP